MCIKFEGTLAKAGNFWSVCIPTLEVYTQGKSPKKALSMIQEALELSVNRVGFAVVIDLFNPHQFVVRTQKAEHEKYLIALMLKNQRAKFGLSLREVAQRLGLTQNAYAQYEYARAIPSLTKVEEFINAMSQNLHVVLDVIDSNAKAA
jgi:DNA-binding XRE family transcriptional regulator